MPLRSAAAVLALGALVALAGDAAHVASGTTTYDWHGLPTVWRSVLWFPVAVASAVLAAALAGRAQGGPVLRRRSRRDALLGAALVLALYLLTALWRDVPWALATLLTTLPAVAIWAWWDPSRLALTLGLGAAVAGPLAEAGVMALGAAHYASDSDQLLGVAPWLAPLYFAAAAVASGLWRALDDG